MTERRKVALEAAQDVIKLLRQCQGMEHLSFSASLIADAIEFHLPKDVRSVPNGHM